MYYYIIEYNFEVEPKNIDFPNLNLINLNFYISENIDNV